MRITRRQYSPLCDFEPVRQFLMRNNRPYGNGLAMGPAGWEYMHTHSYNPWARLTRNRIWECSGEIVAVVHTEWIGYYEMDKEIPLCPLPDGFSLISLAQENDLEKIKRVLWQGFDHEGMPHKGTDKERLMQSGPHFIPSLTTIVKAPSGEYAVYCGMWYEPEIRQAYLEPLCTAPAYRRMGLAKAALYESMRRTKELGAVNCVAGGQRFHEQVGFVPHHNLHTWEKQYRTA